jgi:hypothetical protein
LELHTQAAATGPLSKDDPRARWLEPILYDIYEPDGRYLGRLRVAKDVLNIAFGATRGNDVWTYARDDDGFVVLRRMRMVWEEGYESR